MGLSEQLAEKANGAYIFGSDDSEDSKDDYDNVSEEIKNDKGVI